MASGSAAFWSYVQKDNSGDQGRILALAEDLRERYRIHTGEEFELFWIGNRLGRGLETADRQGDSWYDLLHSYSHAELLQEPACREEILTFARTAERLGLGDLILSV